MKAKDLAAKLLEHPDFEVRFLFNDYFDDEQCRQGGYYDHRNFTIDDVIDVGYSDKVIILGGDEI